MKKNERGFSALAVILVLVIVGLTGLAGWLIWDRQKAESKPAAKAEVTMEIAASKEKTKLDSKIVFEDAKSFDVAEKQKIVSQLAEPLLFYHEDILKISLKGVTIRKNTSMANSADARYALSYPYKDDPASSNLGFLFGYNNKLEYWQPQLCEGNSCNEYPTALKSKFPQNYNAYIACKAATDAGDKQKAGSLGCIF